MMRRWLGIAAAVGVLFAWTRASEATNRYFRDQTVSSASGRFVVEAKSPDNVGETRRPFARSFVYTMRDVSMHRLLWTRVQEEREGSPVRVFVSDDAWTVVWTGHEQLVALRPTTGETALTVSILDQFPEEERERFTHRTTGGMVWAGRARMNFVEFDGRTFFVVRTWWDRRLILDLENGVLVGDPGWDVERMGKGLSGACDASDRAFVLETLEGAAQRWEGADEDWSVRRDIQTAVHLAGRMRLREAAGPLRELEVLNVSTGSSFALGAESSGRVNRHSCCFNELRQAVQLALRRMGEETRELGCVWFRDTEGEGYTGGPGDVVSRAAGSEKVEAGMRPWEVLTLMGAPDFVVRRDAWDYEIGGENGCTLRVHWSDEDRVVRVERIVPPVWWDGEERYVEMNY